tara:strand:- start:1896 stop:2282 length:387 start_codon:yes stop_codon:yes gene_type:complete
MPSRQTGKRKLRKFAIGDLRECISLEDRSIQAPSFDDTSFSEGYTDIIETWAMVETEFKNRVFDDVALEAKPSHKFTIRWRDTITSETRIRYDGDLYRITQTDDTETRKEYLILFAKLDGDESKEANQ